MVRELLNPTAAGDPEWYTGTIHCAANGASAAFGTENARDAAYFYDSFSVRSEV